MKKYTKNIIKKILNAKKNNENKKIEYLKSKFEHYPRIFSYKLTKRFADSLYCHATPGTLETIIETIANLPKKEKLLNLGGGTGQVSNIFRELGFDVYNLDIEVKKEDENEKNIKFNLNSNEQIPVNQKFFNVVICQEIIEHIENPWKLFRDVNDIITPDGLFIISTPNVLSIKNKLKFLMTGFFEWFNPNCFDYHINPIFDWEIKLIAKKTNFDLLSIKGSGDYFLNNKKNKSITKIINDNECLIYTLKPQK